MYIWRASGVPAAVQSQRKLQRSAPELELCTCLCMLCVHACTFTGAHGRQATPAFHSLEGAHIELHHPAPHVVHTHAHTRTRTHTHTHGVSP